MEHVRIGQYNAWRESDNLDDDFEKLLPQVDLLLINEGANHRHTIRKYVQAHPEWDASVPEGGFNESQNSMMYRTSMWATNNRRPDTVRLCEGSGRRSGSHTPPRYMTRKRLIYRPMNLGFQVRVTHMNSHVEKKQWRHLGRFVQYSRQVRKMVFDFKLYKKSTLIQILGMDTNADWRRMKHVPGFPYAALRRQKVISSYDVLGAPRPGTHGNRVIDAIFMRRNQRVKFLSQKVVTGLASDHNALVVTLGVG